jgi:hypothetical protein
MKTPAESPVSAVEPAFVALRDLFAGPLRSVTFPGVDASTLADLVAEAQRRADRVEQARAALAAAQAAVGEAERELAEQQLALAGKSQLAAAYARVYAKDDAELLAAIDHITLPKVRAVAAPSVPAGQVPGQPRRRGRPPKALAAAPTKPPQKEIGAAELPTGDAAGGEAAEEVAAE